MGRGWLEVLWLSASWIRPFPDRPSVLMGGSGGGLASVAGGWEGAEELVRALECSERVGNRGGPPLD